MQKDSIFAPRKGSRTLQGAQASARGADPPMAEKPAATDYFTASDIAICENNSRKNVGVAVSASRIRRDGQSDGARKIVLL